MRSEPSRVGKNSVTRIRTPIKRDRDADRNAVLQLLRLFGGIPLTFADISEELGWSEERTRPALKAARAAGSVRTHTISRTKPHLYSFAEEPPER